MKEYLKLEVQDYEIKESIIFLSKDYSFKYNVELERTKFALVCVSSWLFRLKIDVLALLEIP